MTVTIIRTKSVLPKNWRKTMESQVQKLLIPELSDAFDVAEKILKSRSEAEVQNMANDLVQSIAARAAGKSSAKGPTVVVDPRTIFLLYFDTPISTHPPAQPISESLAIGTLLALVRTCDAVDVGDGESITIEASTSLGNARAFGEWLYLVSRLNDNADALELLFPRQVRTAAKVKIKLSKAAAAKKGWRPELKPEKQAVFEYYEKHKAEFKSLADATTKIKNAKITPYLHSTVYSWLRAYVKAKKAAKG